MTVYISLQCCNISYDIVLKKKLFIKHSQTDLASNVRGLLGPKLKRKENPILLTSMDVVSTIGNIERASKMLVVLVYHASLVRRMICQHAGMGTVCKPVRGSNQCPPNIAPKSNAT